MEHYFIDYAPILFIVVAFLFKGHFFATPAQVSAVKEEIMKEIREEYATKELVETIKEDIRDIKDELTAVRDIRDQIHLILNLLDK